MSERSAELGGPRIGELFAGYGGLGMGVQAVYGGTVAWVSDIDKGANKILAHRFPGVPNHGDITTIDWATVEPVDILTGGSPCQDLSHAGRRAGMAEGTRSNLWVAMREAIAQLRPPMVVWENVRGAVSAAANSDLEPCPGCVGDGSGQPVLRALGRVLGDLSDLGYDARWHGLRASDIGGPHGRFRLFVAATDTQRCGRDGWPPDPQWSPIRRATPAGSRETTRLLPTPTTRDHKGHNQRGDNTFLTGALLPTPTATDAKASGGGYNGQTNVTLTDATVRQPERWGVYGSAIARWEELFRSAPSPAEVGPRDGVRLSARFSEWMMGLPDGWVTDVPEITRNDALRAIGNGVFPRQASEALRVMDSWDVAA